MQRLGNFSDFILEAKQEPATKEEKFLQFAEKRLAGATKIANSAKEKGGVSMLTYYHFVVKLPYYKKAAAGKFDSAAALTELKSLNKELGALLKTFEPKDQIPFQKIMGKIEVIGELLINLSGL